ncbi:MAG: UDP-N-acetyl-D-glucosamine dehydrogenase [Deltaproteobacteria bacterium]|nr:MAG: UDP-N-acetyl-D-glucosamine dehydrogenase [Deltaproteobacteria bacterium]
MQGNSIGAVSIVGLGYVGLPLALAFAGKGIRVIGIDKNPDKVKMLEGGRSYIEDITNKEIRDALGCFYPTTDVSLISDTDNVIICVPTPLSKTREPDISYIISAANDVAGYLRRGMLVVLESTTYPGTTEEVLKSIFEETGLRVGEDFCLAFSPERIDPGNKSFNVKNTPKVVGGVTRRCTERAVELYSRIVDRVVPVSSPATAEAVKLLENTFRAVNIALVNEVAQLCHRMGIDVWEVINAAATKPFGFMPFYPGPGIGGHCIPVDPLYLSWKAKLFNFRTRFIELADEINSKMPEYVVYRLFETLNEVGKSIKGAKILILGVAYKKDIGDIRESPVLEIIKLILEKGGEVIYNDPYVPEFDFLGKRWSSLEITDEVLEASDCVLIHTDHSVYKWDYIAKKARLVLDTRNAVNGAGLGNVYKL